MPTGGSSGSSGRRCSTASPASSRVGTIRCSPAGSPPRPRGLRLASSRDPPSGGSAGVPPPPTAPAMYEQILYDVPDPVAIITLNRPQVLNAWTVRMAAEVKHAVAAAEADPRVVGIVITGAGRGFCAGADLGDLKRLTEGKGIGEMPSELAADPG